MIQITQKNIFRQRGQNGPILGFYVIQDENIILQKIRRNKFAFFKSKKIYFNCGIMP